MIFARNFLWKFGGHLLIVLILLNKYRFPNDILWGVITAKIKFGILLCCFPMQFSIFSLVFLMFSIHRMQILRTTPSSPGTSTMKARLVGPRCFLLTSFLRRVLLHSRSRLVYFAMSTNIPPKGSEIFHRKESFFSFPVRLWGENWRRKGVRPNSQSPSER